MKENIHYSCWLLVFCLVPVRVPAQVMTELQVLPPYSPYLNDYTSRPNQMVISLTNGTSQEQQLYFTGMVTGDNGVSARTRAGYRPDQPLRLGPNATTTFTGMQLQPLFNWDMGTLKGVNTREVERSGLLPEGNYEFCVDVRDYTSGALIGTVQPTACSHTFPLFYPLPPIILQPACGSVITNRPGQQIPFSWTPPVHRDLAVVEYRLRIVEIIPPGRPPGDALQSATTPPLLDIATPTTNYLLNASLLAPAVSRGTTSFAFQVTARDAIGRLVFSNNGVSEPCHFSLDSGGAVLPPGGRDFYTSRYYNPDPDLGFSSRGRIRFARDSPVVGQFNVTGQCGSSLTVTDSILPGDRQGVLQLLNTGECPVEVTFSTLVPGGATTTEKPFKFGSPPPIPPADPAQPGLSDVIFILDIPENVIGLIGMHILCKGETTQVCRFSGRFTVGGEKQSPERSKQTIEVMPSGRVAPGTAKSDTCYSTVAVLKTITNTSETETHGFQFFAVADPPCRCPFYVFGSEKPDSSLTALPDHPGKPRLDRNGKNYPYPYSMSEVDLQNEVVRWNNAKVHIKPGRTLYIIGQCYGPGKGAPVCCSGHIGDDEVYNGEKARKAQEARKKREEKKRKEWEKKENERQEKERKENEKKEKKK